jgi:regulation of enolase protein 1 (concanavalin A-like superfamily)
MKSLAHHHRATLAAVLVMVTAAPLFAQTPPRPAVQLKQLPRFVADTWPTDVNGDGITDLVGAIAVGPLGEIGIGIGRGDGTLNPLSSLNVPATPIAVGDFNNDGKIDLVVSGVAILPGNGNGTFRAARPVTGPPAPPERFSDVKTSHALAADFNGDGRRDLVLVNSSTSSVDVHAGNGDFTFAPLMSLPAGVPEFGGPHQLMVADFDNDGRRDIAAVTLQGQIDVFLNRGGLLFTSFAMHFPGRTLWGITAGDVNRDGNMDLVFVDTLRGGLSWDMGRVGVLLGNGNGRFKRAVYHETGVAGAVTVVVGDFNQDGLLDVATGNRSVEYRDLTCTTSLHYWDTVTIMPGRGNGSFARPRSFALDYAFFPSAYHDTHNSLKTSDVNGDGRTDLIASPGAILLTKAPVANRPPLLFEGPDIPASPDGFTRLEAVVSDPDFDAVRVTWTDATGFRAGDTPQSCGESAETMTFTATATDSEGATTSDSLTLFGIGPEPSFIGIAEPDAGETVRANRPFTIGWGPLDGDPRFETVDVWSSVDDGETWQRIEGCSDLPPATSTCQWVTPSPATSTAFVRVVANNAAGTMGTFGVSDRFSIVTGPATSLPDGWFAQDVGVVAAGGSSTFDGSTFTVTGSGAGIGGIRDEFHFLTRSVGGDFDFIARVVSVQNVFPFTKAGLMVRGQSGSASAHASILATPTAAQGVLTQARLQEGGSTVAGSRVALAPPVWLRLTRRGTTISYAYRTSATGAWISLPSVSPALDPFAFVGFAVSSHVDGRRATARFDNVSLTQP